MKTLLGKYLHKSSTRGDKDPDQSTIVSETSTSAEIRTTAAGIVYKANVTKSNRAKLTAKSVTLP